MSPLKKARILKTNLPSQEAESPIQKINSKIDSFNFENQFYNTYQCDIQTQAQNKNKSNSPYHKGIKKQHGNNIANYFRSV